MDCDGQYKADWGPESAKGRGEKRGVQGGKQREGQPLSPSEISHFRSLLAFVVLAHVLDLITTHFRDPYLRNEGNPVYLWLEHLGLSGWPYLVLTKLSIGGALALGYWWHLQTRRVFLPPHPVRHVRGLLWYGLWQGKSRPHTLWELLSNRRTLRFLGVILAGIAFPSSGLAALAVSVDNVCVLFGQGFSATTGIAVLYGSVLLALGGWLREYWRFYKQSIEAAAETAQLKKA